MLRNIFLAIALPFLGWPVAVTGGRGAFRGTWLCSFVIWVPGLWLALPVGAAEPITVVTANVRYGTADDGPDRWELRRDLVVETLRDLQADLIGTQEMLPFQAEYLREQLADFYYLGQTREPDNPNGEQSGVFVRSARFIRLETGYFWLSERPEEPGSQSWDAALPRMVTWLKLFDRVSQRPLVFINTHFDHRGEEARRQSAVKLREFIETRVAAYPVLVTGDFNCGENSDPYQVLCRPDTDRALPITDVYRQVHPERLADEGTFNGFRGRRDGDRIDWILATREFTGQSAEIIRTARDERYPSDHFFVRAQVKW